MNRAFEGTDFAQLVQNLDGPSALAVATDDVTAPARIIVKFAKTAEKLEVKGGVIEGTYYDPAGITALSAIPSREELLGKFLGSIQSPITNFARVLKQIADKAPAAETAPEAPAAETAPEA